MVSQSNHTKGIKLCRTGSKFFNTTSLLILISYKHLTIKANYTIKDTFNIS